MACAFCSVYHYRGRSPCGGSAVSACSSSFSHSPAHKLGLWRPRPAFRGARSSPFWKTPPASSRWTRCELRACIRRAVQELGIKHLSAPPPSVITVSVGGASTASVDTHSARDLLARADGMLYEAKRGGRNRVEIIPAPGD
ncbi:MAG: diguanylate cyclase [Spirochaetales bacterium]|nr:diguanylate cyclase [Leptospiraceae bacterium]MCP5482563.1 diguanylate cyclase [Spirochaetales bacterium]MCP5485153.1 diguanylate cyclase [Spirochaetales bacterium]